MFLETPFGSVYREGQAGRVEIPGAPDDAAVGEDVVAGGVALDVDVQVCGCESGLDRQVEGDDVEDEGLGEKAVREHDVGNRGEYIWGGDGVRGVGDLVGRVECVAIVLCGGGAGGEVIELLW